jgi:hypothetical protein
MKIRVYDKIGCLWTIARVDVGRTVFVCCRADPEHVVVTFPQGNEFRAWLKDVFSPSVVRLIILRIVLVEGGESVLADLYFEYVQSVEAYDNAISLCENQMASRILAAMDSVSNEISRVEANIIERCSHESQVMSSLLNEWNSLIRERKQND